MERPGGVPRGARSRGPQFTPRQRFATFALRLGPFAWEFCDGAPVCGENDAFPERKGDLNLGNEHRSAAKTMPGSADAGTRAEISVSLQTGAPLRKFRSPFRSRKASFSLQTGAPSRKKEPNGPRRRATVANRCLGVKWGTVFAVDRCSVATIQLPNSGPCFASEKYRFRCGPVLRREKKNQTGSDVEQKLRIDVGG